ncbi:MAG: alkaline phosphatase family protein [Pyrinomonadaceae bacterium]
MFSKCLPFAASLVVLALWLLAGWADAQGVKRVVVIKIDGLPAYYVDRFVKERDPVTGKSVLPWFDEVFYKNGTRVPNFYTRGMSLSGPSWGQLDTGQHLQIKGNVEYDRYTSHAYDYLNFLPYYIGYAGKTKMDMPAVEVLDQLKIPLLVDMFPYERRYTSNQLYQRGNQWEVLASGVAKLYPGNVSDFIDEWTMGLDFRGVTIHQAERDIVGKLVKRPDIDYFDYYDVSFDHVSHHNNDALSRLTALKELDGVIGNFWVAINSSSRADETALVLVSDHGVNSDTRAYSQGYNLVRLLGSQAGGGHHVVTKRRLMLDYSVKGVYPLVPLIKTSSPESFYLQGQSKDYPTALLDFDGNERASVHLRNSDLNLLHILLQQMKNKKLSSVQRSAVVNTFFRVIDKHRPAWSETRDRFGEELDVIGKWRRERERSAGAKPRVFDADERRLGLDKEDLRQRSLTQLDSSSETEYREYLATVNRLLALEKRSFDPNKIEINSLIAPEAMGEPNSLHQLQNYIVGMSPRGLMVGADDHLDVERSFIKVNYFDLLTSQRVRNNVQADVSSRPVDFVAVRLPANNMSTTVTDAGRFDDAVWLNGGNGKEAVILSRNIDGVTSYRYLPVSNLRQHADDSVTFEPQQWSAGFPLRYWEDKDLEISAAERTDWLRNWHTELEWLKAIHKTNYSIGLISLNEQLISHPIFRDENATGNLESVIMDRFRRRQRRLTEPDLLILANNHWNFDVRGFNPGGNHGSFLRVSTNSTLMLAGGARTAIPKGLAVDQPYDSLSFVPTILKLMGEIDDQNRSPDSFNRFPGRVIKEVTEAVNSRE